VIDIAYKWLFATFISKEWQRY